jgi:hypothetical protein
MHEFSRGFRACSREKCLNLESLKCHFLDFGERFYTILMVRKRHCNLISEASLANVFALQPEPGGPHLAHWGWGPIITMQPVNIFTMQQVNITKPKFTKWRQGFCRWKFRTYKFSSFIDLTKEQLRNIEYRQDQGV